MSDSDLSYSGEFIDQAFDNVREAYERWYDFAAGQRRLFEARYRRIADTKSEGEDSVSHSSDGKVKMSGHHLKCCTVMDGTDRGSFKRRKADKLRRSRHIS